jgi:transcriptional regulator with XRE-family HTH domain
MASTGVAINATELKDLRLRLGMSMRAVSDATAAIGPRVGYSSISGYERGTHRPHPRTLLALATALGTSVDALRIREAAELAS